jgi:hypothetical protein
VIRRGRARPTVSGTRSLPPLVWGLLLVAGGFLTWKAVPRHEAAPAWIASAGPATTASVAGPAAGGMTSGIEELRETPPLLRMEWPAQPGASGYRILFHVDGEAIASPLTSPTPVFLYDLDSNILGLPDRFDWAVSAVLPDGREIVSPWQHHSAP